MSLNITPQSAPRPIAFYVHHHGSGHATRCKQIVAHWPGASPVHIFTSAPRHFEGWEGGAVHELPPDVEDGRDPRQDILDNQVLHYAPTDCRSVSRRMAILAQWIAEQQPKLFIVDLSCEIALFARLCGAKVALVRLHGFRRDAAHVAAFQLADVLLAPFPVCFEDEHTEEWIREKTIYLGLFSRYDDRTETKEECRNKIGKALDQNLVVVINGSGGGDRSLDHWEETARLNPDHHFLLVGQLNRITSNVPNLDPVGYVNDTFPYLKSADVIIGSGGTNTLGEVAAVDGRFLSLPEPRPFNEQAYKMNAVERVGLTRAIDPGVVKPTDWRKWLRRAGDLQPERWRKVRYLTNFPEAVARLAGRYSGEGVGTPVSIDYLLGR